MSLRTKVRMQIKNREALARIADSYRMIQESYTRRVLLCGGDCCVSSNCRRVREALELAVMARGLENEVNVLVTGCMGACALGPVMLVEPEGVLYTAMNPEKVDEIVRRHLVDGETVREYTYYDPAAQRQIPRMADIELFARQERVALRNVGRIDCRSLEAYIAADGYFGLAGALDQTPAEVRESLCDAGLRARGVAPFLLGERWEAAARSIAGSDCDCIVGTVAEGSAAAWIDRSLLEGDPHSLVEAMLLAGYATGARRGVISVRGGELALKRLCRAVEQARQAGLLGSDILGSGFDFQLEVFGDERDDRAPEGGAWVGNVQTLACVVPVLQHGGFWYRSLGAANRPGTEVHALGGGLVELPTDLRPEDIAFGSPLLLEKGAYTTRDGRPCA